MCTKSYKKKDRCLYIERHIMTLTMVWKYPFKYVFVVSVDVELVKQFIKINSILEVTKISVIRNTKLKEDDHMYKIL